MLKGLFGASRQGRRDDAELGKGVWRRAHDRFRRGLDRFHQMLEGVEEEARNEAAAAVRSAAKGLAAASNQENPRSLTAGTAGARQSENYAALVPVANGLADLLPLVRGIAVRAQAIAPSEGTEIPTGTGGYLNDVHRELSRAGNALAAAAEAVAMVRLGAGDVSAVERRAALVQGHVQRAEELLGNGPSERP